MEDKLIHVGILLFEDSTTTIVGGNSSSSPITSIDNNNNEQQQQLRIERIFVEKRLYQNGHLLYFTNVNNYSTSDFEGYFSILGCIVDQLHPVEQLCFRLTLLSDIADDNSEFTPTTRVFKARDPQDWQMWLSLFGLYSNSKIPKQAISLPLLKLPAQFQVGDDSPNPIHHRNFNHSAPAQVRCLDTPTITPRPPRDWDDDAAYLIERFPQLEVAVVLDCIDFCQGDRDEAIALLSAGVRLSYQGDLNGFSPIGHTNDDDDDEVVYKDSDDEEEQEKEKDSEKKIPKYTLSPARPLTRTISLSHHLDDLCDDNSYDSNDEEEEEEDEDYEEGIEQDDTIETNSDSNDDYSSIINNIISNNDLTNSCINVNYDDVDVQYVEGLMSETTQQLPDKSPTFNMGRIRKLSRPSSNPDENQTSDTISTTDHTTQLSSSTSPYSLSPSSFKQQHRQYGSECNHFIATSSSFEEQHTCIEAFNISTYDNYQSQPSSADNFNINNNSNSNTTTNLTTSNSIHEIPNHNNINNNNESSQTLQQTSLQPQSNYAQSYPIASHNSNPKIQLTVKLKPNNDQWAYKPTINKPNQQQTPSPSNQSNQIKQQPIQPIEQSTVQFNPNWKPSTKTGSAWDLNVSIIGSVNIQQYHTEYKIYVKTSYSEWSVYRRYNNFCLLDQKLQKMKIVTKKQHQSNPLPPKKLLSLSDEVVKSRSIQLQRYLQVLLTSHPGIFYSNPFVNVFFNGEISSDIFSLFIENHHKSKDNLKDEFNQDQKKSF